MVSAGSGPTWGRLSEVATRRPSRRSFARRLILMFSFVGDVVLDPFAGRGRRRWRRLRRGGVASGSRSRRSTSRSSGRSSGRRSSRPSTRWHSLAQAPAWCWATRRNRCAGACSAEGRREGAVGTRAARRQRSARRPMQFCSAVEVADASSSVGRHVATHVAEPCEAKEEGGHSGGVSLL